MQAFGMALILFVIIGVPMLTVVGGIAFSGFTRRYFEYKREELALRRWEAEQARLSAVVPAWLDRSNPHELAAWHSAVRETVRLTLRTAEG